MQALILAGGLGTRLRSVIGADLPKPMATFAGRPFLSWLVLQLRREGIRDLWLLTGHGASVVQTYFGTGDAHGVRLRYSVDPSPLGTGGALRHVLPKLEGDRFLVTNGDSFLSAPLRPLLDAHAGGTAAATLALVAHPDAGRFGSVDLGPDGAIRAFREKDPAGGPGIISAGIYVVERHVLDAIPAGRPVSLEREVWPALTAGRLRGVVLDGAFTDMGIPEAFAALQADPSPLVAIAGDGVPGEEPVRC
jgi:D-glycero-alpha-D-manno-heptose 1-phosphate guanylyltransferase